MGNPIPAGAADSAPTNTVTLNREWAGILSGLLEDLRDPDYWNGDEAQQIAAIDQVENLQYLLMSETCDPQDLSTEAYQFIEQADDFAAPTLAGHVRLFAKATGWFFRRVGQAAIRLLTEADLANLTFPTGARIRGNFHDATRSNRVIFQSSANDQISAMGVMPSGSGAFGAYLAYGKSDPDNAEILILRANNGLTQIISDKSGSVSFAPIGFSTGGLEVIRIDTSGRMGIGTNAPTALLDINSNTLRLRTARTIASAGAAGNPGDICWDDNYLYVYTATNTWKRIALATW